MAQEVIQDQIKHLELAAAGVQKEQREVIQEVIKDIAQGAATVPPTISPSQPISAITILPDAAEKEHAEIINHYFEEAIAKNLFAAIKEVEKLKNPHLADDFHAKLAQYFDQLLQARRLTP